MTEFTSDIEDLIEEFAFLDNWEERYRHVIELGQALEPLTDSERSDVHRVKGCVSQVWLVTEGQGDVLAFRGDSDAHIVRGLISLLIRIYSGKRKADILSIDARAIFQSLGLDEHLSPQRSNGLNAMMLRIRRDAAT